MTTLTGTENADTLNGGAADDSIVGLGGNDSLSGGDGNDTLSAVNSARRQPFDRFYFWPNFQMNTTTHQTHVYQRASPVAQLETNPWQY